MYNDYYLQQIDNKMAINNSRLQDIIETQETIIQNQEILISGDKDIVTTGEKIATGTYVITLIGAMFLIYYFIMRCLR